MYLISRYFWQLQLSGFLFLLLFALLPFHLLFSLFLLFRKNLLISLKNVCSTNFNIFILKWRNFTGKCENYGQVWKLRESVKTTGKCENYGKVWKIWIILLNFLWYKDTWVGGRVDNPICLLENCFSDKPVNSG